MTTAVPVAFWLLPCARDRQWLMDVVHGLAQRHGGPPFEPHVTLHVAACRPDVDLEELLGTLASRSPRLELGALSTGESAAYYKALFVEIDAEQLDGERLLGLRSQLVDLLAAACGAGNGEAYAFLPHLSLLYGELPQPLRATLAAQNDLRGRSIVFDGIAAVRPAAGHRDLAQVAQWEVFGHQLLRG